MSRFFALLATGSALLFGGCGSDDPAQRSAAPAASEGAKKALAAWLDDRNCDALTNGYVEEITGDESADARATCREQVAEGVTGVRAGQYTAEVPRLTGDRGTIAVRLNDGGDREYTLQRRGPFGWAIAGRSESYETQVGRPLRFIDSLTINDRPNDVDARVTVLSVKVVPQLPANLRLTYPKRGGHVFVRARIEIQSLAKETFEFNAIDFALLSSDGERIREEGADVFKPALMNLKLVEGDTARGYIAFQMRASAKPKEIRLASSVDPSAEPRRWAVE